MDTATVFVGYGGATSLTCTLANLGTGAARQSDPQDMTATKANRPIDALLSVKITLLTGGTTGNDNAVYIYPYGSVDEVNFSADLSAGLADAAYTMRTGISYLGPFVLSFPTATAAPSFVGGPWSIAQCFGGVLPKKWGIIVNNATNTPLNTGTLLTATYVTIWNVAE